MSAVAIKLNNETFQGFWFLTNYLRKEGLQEEAVMNVVGDLTQQYDAYRGPGGKDFGPTFKTEMPREHCGMIKMYQPVSEEQIGDVMFAINENGSVEIVPF